MPRAFKQRWAWRLFVLAKALGWVTSKQGEGGA